MDWIDDSIIELGNAQAFSVKSLAALKGVLPLMDKMYICTCNGKEMQIDVVPFEVIEVSKTGLRVLTRHSTKTFLLKSVGIFNSVTENQSGFGRIFPTKATAARYLAAYNKVAELEAFETM